MGWEQQAIESRARLRKENDQHYAVWINRTCLPILQSFGLSRDVAEKAAGLIIEKRLVISDIEKLTEGMRFSKDLRSKTDPILHEVDDELVSLVGLDTKNQIDRMLRALSWISDISDGRSWQAVQAESPLTVRQIFEFGTTEVEVYGSSDRNDPACNAVDAYTGLTELDRRFLQRLEGVFLTPAQISIVRDTLASSNQRRMVSSR